MYAAFYLNEKATDASQRVRFCTPMTADFANAWAILRSARLQDTHGGVLAAPKEALTAAIQAIQRQAGDLPSSTAQALVKIQTWARELGAKVMLIAPEQEPMRAVAREILLVHMAGHKAEAAGAIQPPEVGLYPNFINPKAQRIWDFVVVQYAEKIAEFKGQPLKQWTVAVIIFKRSCARNGIPPFVEDTDAFNTKYSREVAKRVESGNKRADAEVAQLAGRFLKAKLLSRVGQERFSEAHASNGKFYLTTERFIQVASTSSIKDVLYRLRGEYGYKAGKSGGAQYAHRHVDSVTDILWKESGPNRIKAYVALVMSKPQALTLLGVPNDTSDDVVVSRLIVAAQRWFRGGKLAIAQVATAATAKELVSRYGMSFQSGSKEAPEDLARLLLKFSHGRLHKPIQGALTYKREGKIVYFMTTHPIRSNQEFMKVYEKHLQECLEGHDPAEDGTEDALELDLPPMNQVKFIIHD